MERQLAVFVWFKRYSKRGMLKISPADIQDCAAALNVSTRTIKNILQSLQKHKWITFNPLTKYYYIAGWNFVMNMYGYVGRTGIHYEPEDLQHFKAFLAAAKITHLQNDFRKKEWRKNKAGRTKTDSYKPYEVPQFLLSSNAFSTCLGGVSLSKARTLKNKAKRYVSVRKNTCVPVNLKSADVRSAINRGVEGTEGLVYSHKYRKYFKQLPDMVTSELKLTQRKK